MSCKSETSLTFLFLSFLYLHFVFDCWYVLVHVCVCLYFTTTRAVNVLATVDVFVHWLLSAYHSSIQPLFWAYNFIIDYIFCFFGFSLLLLRLKRKYLKTIAFELTSNTLRCQISLLRRRFRLPIRWFYTFCLRRRRNKTREWIK